MLSLSLSLEKNFDKLISLSLAISAYSICHLRCYSIRRGSIFLFSILFLSPFLSLSLFHYVCSVVQCSIVVVSIKVNSPGCRVKKQQPRSATQSAVFQRKVRFSSSTSLKRSTPPFFFSLKEEEEEEEVSSTCLYMHILWVPYRTKEFPSTHT